MSRLEIQALQVLSMGPIDLTIESSECVSVMGASGSGKTLFLRALADLDAHEGSVRFDGTLCAATPAPAWRRRVGMLPPESAWWADDVAPHFPAGYEGDELQALGFGSDVLGFDVHRLSTGERQRLALARLLAIGPEALLLDEPTASLDVDNVARVEALVECYCRGKEAPVIWVSHDREQARRVASRHFELRDGRLVAS